MPVTVTVYEYSFTVAAGDVIRTDPAEGEEVGADETVTVYVSLGPQSLASPTQAVVTQSYPRISIGFS